jgi:hypothetical protein
MPIAHCASARVELEKIENRIADNENHRMMVIQTNASWKQMVSTAQLAPS